MPSIEKRRGTFRSLRSFNYRLWAIGALISNVGTWMQRTAQDWIVLTDLTAHNATAVGITMGLQFGPQLLLLPFTGFVADHFDRRKLLFATQAAMGFLALGLGLVTLTGWVRLWQVYVFAALLGCVTAFDSTVRHTFVSELVSDTDLSNAVALNSSSFNAARMTGPAIAGLLIATVGSGWVFLINGATFVATLCALGMLRREKLYPRERAVRARGNFIEGFRYVWARPNIRSVLLMMFLFGTFGLNFPIYISTMAVKVFGMGPDGFGALSSMMATGSVIGALLSAKREEPNVATLIAGGMLFGLGLMLAALMPGYWLFGTMLALAGLSAQAFNTTANSTVQLRTDPSMRGRVMAILLALSAGGTLFGAPIVGWVADRFGPRSALGVGASAGFGAALIGLSYLAKYRQLRVRLRAGRLRFNIDEDVS